MFFPTRDGHLLNAQHIVRFEPVLLGDGSVGAAAIMVDGKRFELGKPVALSALDAVRRLVLLDSFEFCPFDRGDDR